MVCTLNGLSLIGGPMRTSAHLKYQWTYQCWAKTDWANSSKFLIPINKLSCIAPRVCVSFDSFIDRRPNALQIAYQWTYQCWAKTDWANSSKFLIPINKLSCIAPRVCVSFDSFIDRRPNALQIAYQWNYQCRAKTDWASSAKFLIPINETIKFRPGTFWFSYFDVGVFSLIYLIEIEDQRPQS